MFKLLSTREVYRNPWIQVREDQVIKPGGSPGIYGVVTMLPGSSVVAIGANEEVYLVKEFKYAIGRFTIELPSGGLDGDEPPLEAAKRELREEAGLAARKWTDLGAVDPFTSAIHSPNYLFLAEELEEVGAQPDEGEVIERIQVPFPEAVEMVMNGEITHGASCIAILKAARLRHREGGRIEGSHARTG